MPKFMKMLNNISRSQSVYRAGKLSCADLQSCQYAYVLAICKKPGMSQEEIASELCVNKSTAARTLNRLEENGYISRLELQDDKRRFSVNPTEKMLAVLPKIKNASREWMEMLSEDIPNEELVIFNSVLERMEKKAREIINRQEVNK